MPPRTQMRRRSRDPNANTPNAALDNRLLNFQKPNLPSLQGTPSSRRQYSYGSPLEPAPAYHSRTRAPGNLASAVQGALESGGRGEQVQVLVDQGSKLRHHTARASTVNEDELLGSEADYRPDDEQFEDLGSDALAQPESPEALPEPSRLIFDDDDMSDARSFGMEDDYFDEAIIGSVTGDVVAPPALPRDMHPPHSWSLAPPAPTTTLVSARSRLSRATRGGRPALVEPGVLPFSDDELDLGPQSIAQSKGRPSSSLLPGLAADKHADRNDASSLITPPETDSQLSQEIESARNSFEKPAEASAPSILASISSRAGLFQARRPSSDPIHGQSRTKGSQPQRPCSDGSHPPDSRRQLNISSAGLRPDFFGRTGGPGGDGPKAAEPPSRNFWFSPRRSDRGDSSQRLSTPPNPDDDAPPRRRGADLDFRRRHESPSSDSSYLSDDVWVNWSQLSQVVQVLNPMPRLQAIWMCLASAKEFMLNILLRQLSYLRTDDFQDQLRSVVTNVIFAFAAVCALLVAASISRSTYDSLPSEMPSVAINPRQFPISLPSLGNVAGSIGRFVPSFSWASPEDDYEYKWEETSGDGDGVMGSDERRFQKMEQWLRDMHRELIRSKDSSRMHEASLKKLESVVPKLVHMPLKDGKPAVAPEFWHAIRDLIHQDDTFLSLEKKKSNEYDFANEKQWRSIVSRLNNDPAFATQLNQSISRIEDSAADKVTQRLPAFWDSWVSNNDNKISQMVGTAVDRLDLPNQRPEDLDDRISELVKKHANQNHDGSGVVFTRDEFLRYLNNEFSAHRAEIRNEINELRPKFEKLVQDSIALAKEDDLPEGMSRSEVERLVQSLISKSIADMNLEALARGRIHAYWDKDLRNQVNYFGIGAGAIINAKLTSQTYLPGTEDANRKGLMAKEPRPALDALMPWLDDGDCWCAARNQSDRGNPHDVFLVVMLGHSIIPQQVVVEHIPPLATTDPGARPRDIEVYAPIEDPVVRERVQDFAAVHFPADKDDWEYTPAALPPCFVKIGQFAYEEGAAWHDGVHVHHLSTELLALGAETDQVAVRAVSNYGARLHTCFYRVRLFGQKME